MFRCMLFLSVLLVATPELHAQAKLRVGPSMLTAGGTANVEVTDASRAGRTVIVEIDNGSVTHPRSDFVEITLDDQGRGQADWDVPNDPEWQTANFNAPSGPGVSRIILDAPGPAPIEELGALVAHEPLHAAQRGGSH